jgi:rod shape-determining protein MreD
MIRPLINSIVTFFLLVFLQVFVFNNIQISGYINPYFYIIFILLLPFETPGWVLIISSFLIGLMIDIFTHTLGMHAMACTFMAFIRPSVLKSFAPRDGYESGTVPRVSIFGLSWFIKYALILVFAHHLVLFYVEMFRFSDFFYTFFRVLMSTFFTTLLIVISQYFVWRK